MKNPLFKYSIYLLSVITVVMFFIMGSSFRGLTFPFSEYYNLEIKKINRAKQEKDGKKRDSGYFPFRVGAGSRIRNIPPDISVWN